MSIAMAIGSFLLLACVSVYLLVRNGAQYFFYSLVLFLVFASVFGFLFKILHLPGADELLLAGFAGTALGASFLLWRSFQNRQRQILFYKLATALMLMAVMVFAFLWPEHSSRIELLNYPLTAFLGTILINKQYEHEGEKNMIVLFLVQAFLYIIIEILKLF